MKKTTFIFFAAMGLVPIGLINVHNLNPFNTVVLLILLSQFPTAVRTIRAKDPIFSRPSLVVFFVVCTVVLGYVNMVLGLGKFADWTAFYCLNYLLFWVVLREVHTFNDIDRLFRRLAFFTILAAGWLVFFFFRPEVLEGAFTDIRMGSYRGEVGGLSRIFTPGMEYISVALMFVVSYFAFGKPRRPLMLTLLFVLCLLVIVIITSVRTYVAGLLVALLIILVLKVDWRTIRLLLVGSLVIAVLFLVLPGGVQEYVVERVAGITDLSDVDVETALDQEMGEGTTDEGSLGTLYWRILEVPYALSLMTTPREIVFGSLGRLYSFIGVEDAAAPHISAAGIFYLFGLVGLMTFSTFIVYFSIRIVRLNRLYKTHPRRYLAVFTLIAWINLFLFSFGGGIYYSTTTAIVAGICGLTVILERLRGETGKEASAAVEP